MFGRADLDFNNTDRQISCVFLIQEIACVRFLNCGNGEGKLESGTGSQPTFLYTRGSPVHHPKGFLRGFTSASARGLPGGLHASRVWSLGTFEALFP
jgi:hypothetical protein